jgi:hypothetical protein
VTAWEKIQEERLVDEELEGLGPEAMRLLL